jgi:choline dehydrogenase-like flavoprotein
MHLIDARRLDAGHDFGEHDVCVVGAGAAGAYVAHRLGQLGLRVLLLEAGGQTCVRGDALGIGLELGGSSYRGATLGRAFGLGGTTSLWGGQLVPYADTDIPRPAEALASAWQHIVARVAEHGRQVRCVLGLPPERATGSAGPFEPEAQRLRAAGLSLLASERLPFHRRNFSKLLSSTYSGRGRVDVCLHALVRRWSLAAGSDGSAHVESVTLRSAGREHSVRAPAFVLAAGAIESARSLLEIRASCATDPFRERSIGQNLTDHLSCTVARVPGPSRAAIIERFGPRFEAGALTSPRFLDAAPLAALARGFFHFIFELDSPGLRLARKALSALQARRRPELSLDELRSGTRGLFGLGYERVVRSRLHVPEETPMHLQLDLEQLPSAERCITLNERRDAFDRPLAELRWGVSPADLEQVSRLTRRFAQLWSGSPELPELEFELAAPASATPLDAYHPAGVCRLGSDAAAVVAPDLRVHGTENLWHLSTGVFPSAGSANPVFSLLCLGESLARQLARRVTC